MADDVNVQTTPKKLSHKLFKRLLQKEKRRLKRQKAAEGRNQEELNEQQKLENDVQYRRRIEATETGREKQEILQREINEKLWLEREAKAQEEFHRKIEDEKRRIKLKEEQERSIKLEWEHQQEKEKDEKEKKETAIKEKEEALFREIKKETGSSQSEERFHNPVAPSNYGTEKDVVNCAFFLKTGACRFGERCSRFHPRPSSSTTLLIPTMYADIRHTESALDIADRDTGLEFDDKEANEKFLEFYDDVYPEFQRSGRIIQFKVCCNFEHHLRGNVYVQYTSEEDCQKAFADFNGRWYAGRQLSCEFSPVTNWKSAICGFFERNCCPRGKNCNFLHVYRNRDDDRFVHRSENRRYGCDRPFSRERDTRHHSMRSRVSGDRSRSGHDSRRNDDRDESVYEGSCRRSRRRRSRSYSDEENYPQRRRRSRSRSRHRSRSRGKSRDRSTSRDRRRARNRAGSRARSGSYDMGRRRSRSRSRSVSSSRSGGRGRTSVNAEENDAEGSRSRPLSVNGDMDKQSDDETTNDDYRRRERAESASSDGDRSSRSNHKSKKKHKKHKKHKRRHKSRNENELSATRDSDA